MTLITPVTLLVCDCIYVYWPAFPKSCCDIFLASKMKNANRFCLSLCNRSSARDVFLARIWAAVYKTRTSDDGLSNLSAWRLRLGRLRARGICSNASKRKHVRIRGKSRLRSFTAHVIVITMTGPLQMLYCAHLVLLFLLFLNLPLIFVLPFETQTV